MNENITVVRRDDLVGRPWQIDVVVDGRVRSHLIDSATELQRILMMPRGKMVEVGT